MVNPPLDFSRHARNRMRRNRISREVVSRILTQPVAVTPAREGRSHAWGLYPVPRTRTEWLTVTFTEEDGVIVIITVTPRRRGPEGR